MRDAVVFAIYNKETQQCLLEQRLPDSHYAPSELVFPGGNMKEIDTSIYDAFLRELTEEIGINPSVVISLLTQEYPEDKVKLHPFVITKWTGDIPDKVLDKGNPLLWQPIATIAAF